MNQRRSKQTDIVDIVNLGFFLLLVGVIFATTPNLFDRISDFIKDFKLQEITPNWKLPAPAHIQDHKVLYTAIYQFCSTFAIFQILVLGARFILRDPIDKKAGTVASLVFWFGASWMIVETIDRWFVFLGWLITLIGVSLIIKNAIVLATQLYRKT